MTQLEKQIKETQTLLKNYNEGVDNRDIIGYYTDILSEISALPEELGAELPKIVITRDTKLQGLLTNSYSEDELTEQQFARDAIDNFQIRWQKEDYRAREGDALKKVTEAYQNLTKQIKVTNKNQWAQWTNGLRDTFTVEKHILDSQKGLPNAEKCVADFKKYTAEFDELVADITDVDKVKSIQNHLIKLREGMDFDVPAEVRRFLDAVSQLQGADISMLLSGEVIPYLEKHNLLAGYKVKRANRY